MVVKTLVRKNLHSQTQHILLCNHVYVSKVTMHLLFTTAGQSVDEGSIINSTWLMPIPEKTRDMFSSVYCTI